MSKNVNAGDVAAAPAAEHADHIDNITPVKETDKAALFLKEMSVTGPIIFTPEEEKAVLRKIDWRILPLILIAYFFQQLDKSTLSCSSVFDMPTDANLHGTQFSWLGSSLYLAQLVAQPLAALTLVKLPTGKVIAGAIFLWGSSLCIMSACTTFKTLLVMRLFLGTFESLIAPSLIAVTQMWWKRNEQTLRTSYCSEQHSLLLPDNLPLLRPSYRRLLNPRLSPHARLPMEAKFLSDREKVVTVERLRSNQMGIVSRQWKWDHVKESILDIKTWCWFFLVITISIPSGGISTFGSLIVKSFGYNKFQTMLFNIPFGAVQMCAIIGSGWLATKYGRKGPIIMLLCITPIISVYPGITPLIFAWDAQNTAGDTKRKVTTGVMFVGLCTGNVIGPLLYSTDQAPLYRKGLISNLCMLILVIILTAIVTLYLLFLNKSHARRRLALGKSEVIVDRSMLQSSVAAELESNEEMVAHDHDFEDMTDLKNEDFIFVY
ncbi:allantoate permease [Fusarium circinatum]|uniref:Allantoate permease n=1 Tax=Fusarium circinatum TaxID=48490 RepID=A0A8H5T3U2_FUSCI|nr:allantoate permease [Fusarium circinatum]